MFDRSNKSGVRRTLAVAMALLPALQPLTPALAGSTEQAERLFGRITGTPPSASVLTQMSTDISSGNALAAAQLAMQDPNFYNVTLRNFAAPMTNKRTVGIRAAERLHRDHHRHGARQRAVQHRAVGRPGLHRQRVRRAGLFTGQQQSLPVSGYQRRRPVEGAAAADAVGSHRHTVGRDRGCHDHARRGLGVLLQRDQPRDGAVHDDQLHVLTTCRRSWISRGRRTASARIRRAPRAATAACSSAPASAAIPGWTRSRARSPTTTST